LRGGDPRGFTLVEMLVSAALVVLIMLMFAEVYQVAADSVGRQKGIAENDQRSRTLTTIINNDIESRTFRRVLPIHPTLETNPIDDAALRVGYFYISENDPQNDTDDVLQLTVNVLRPSAAPATPDDPLLTGRATLLDPNEPNQPEADDGQLDFTAAPINVTPNQTGASPVAEVSYFVRNGNLIRRVMLVRRPYPDSAPAQPPVAIFPAADYPAAASFWNDFDYSAYYPTPGGTGPQFHNAIDVGPGDLNNDDSSALPSFGRPHFRFGHDHVTGNPREYVNQPALAFMGRFTQEETSDVDFGYPGRIPDLDGAGAPFESPFDPATDLSMVNGVVTFQNGGDGTWGTNDDVPFDGLRRGEDILMTHVHAFDVKVFDQAYDETAVAADLNHNGRIDDPAIDGGSFADVGHGAVGDYAQTNNLHDTAAPQIIYGPRTTSADNRIFDTWHHQVDINDDNMDSNPSIGTFDPPPFWPNDGGVPPVGRPLRAIQITIRFFDVASGQMRQLTLVESLVD